ncbi:hypothetical protein Vretimale_419 [Volvox reticuliferus]|uniref:Uncharacterized protein n=1 Tax=Volvox reticuliferus TaxID=1737510 RepID=A0A8J4C1D6_9CHLO|nr:hypothetical protein Vretifemale_2638 [Volvox reticuliferus]GIL94101.1 hypothetical protein Vretimale_419 [Volvox reticuliferus]
MHPQRPCSVTKRFRTPATKSTGFPASCLCLVFGVAHFSRFPLPRRPSSSPRPIMASAASPASPGPTTRPTLEPSTTPGYRGLRPFFDARLEIGAAEVATGAADVEVEADVEERCQDVGNIVLMEHINLEVPDLEVARLFYGEGLGLTADPGTTAAQRGGYHVMWYNIGKQQFHIARGPTAQVLPPGSVVGMVMPNVAAMAERLEGVRRLLGDVSLTYARGDTLEVVDPYGNTFVVHASLPHFPGRQGIAYVQLPCFRGTAHRIAAFYAARMGARCRVSTPGLTSSPAGAGAGITRDGGTARGSTSGAPVRAEVLVGPNQRLVFVEQAQLGPLSDQAVASLFGGWHLAMYVADFSTTFRAIHHPNRPPFNEHPYRDKYSTLRDALRNHQFRFQDIIATEPGEGQGEDGVLLYRISHEVRSLHHPLYGRPLYGRETGFA